MLFTEINRVKDNHQKTVVFFINKTYGTYSYIFGYVKKLEEYFSENYNIVYVGYESKDNYNLYKNLYAFNKSDYTDIKDSKFKRASDMDEHRAYNNQFLRDEIEVSLQGITNVEKVFIIDDNSFILPLQPFSPDKDLKIAMNEFHDYVGSDPEYIAKVNDMNGKITNNIYDRVNSLAFTQYEKAIAFLVVEYLHKRFNPKEYFNFIIDPTFYHPWFKENNIPLKSFYFARDSRGTRDFYKFPIAELQHLTYDKQTKKKPKLYDFFFAGSILQDKGSRKECWYTFFNDLKLENSSLFVPLIANGIIKSKTVGVSNKERKAKEKMETLYTDVAKHNLYQGHIFPEDLNRTIKKYKYGMVLRCVSKEDSLNFRPINYLNLDILPFLDWNYDPECLQIPNEFQEKLLVNCSADIERLVEYYNTHDDERIKLLEDMKAYFEIEAFKLNWKDRLNEVFNQ